MSEQVFYENKKEGIRVTESRFIVGSQTYAMSAVASVAASQVPPNRWVQAAILLAGVIFIGPNLKQANIWQWFIAFGPGIFWLLVAQTRYSVVLQVSSGATRALTTNSEKLARAVADAINEVIVFRDRAK